MDMGWRWRTWVWRWTRRSTLPPWTWVWRWKRIFPNLSPCQVAMVVEMMAKVVEDDVVAKGKDSLLSMPPPLCLLLCLFPLQLPHLPLQPLHPLPLLPDLLLLLPQVGVVLQTHADCFLEELVLADADADVVCLAMSDIFICTWKLKLTLVLKSFLKRLERL